MKAETGNPFGMGPGRLVLRVFGLAVLLFGAGGCQVIKQISGIISGDTPAKWAREMENPDSPDLRWQGMSKLVEKDFGKRPPYTTRYQQIARDEEDPIVRAYAIRALNRARDNQAAESYIKALEDESPLVRLEGAKALVNMPNTDSIERLIALVNRPEEPRDVKIAAAEALKHYPRLEVGRVLVAQLNERDFGVAWQAHRSLKQMTKREFGYDEGAWLTYFTGPEKPFG